MRFDRAITLSLVAPIRQLAGASKIGRDGEAHFQQIPILMYHAISDDPEPGRHPYYRTNTSPARFRQQIQFLAENGYQTLDLHDAVKWLKANDVRNHLPPKSFDENLLLSPTRPVVVTFDDGFRNFYTEAFQVLRRYGFAATVFLPTGLIRNENSTRIPETSKAFAKNSFGGGFSFLTWTEVRQLRRAGISFGSHSVTHPRFVNLSWPEVEAQVRQSKVDIEEHLGEPITTFAYPFSFPQNETGFVKRFKALLEDTGYECCVTTEIGRVKRGDEPYRLKRLPVNSSDDLRFFRAKLEGSYDWLSIPQSMAKRLKGHRVPA